MTEHARQADDFQRPAFHFDVEVFGQCIQLDGLWSVFDSDLPELAMARAVEFAGAAERAQLTRRRFDACTFFPDQKQLATGQTRGQGVEQVVGEVLGFGQEQHSGLEGLGGGVCAEMSTLAEAGIQRGEIPGMPTPAPRVGQRAQQIVGGKVGQQQ